MHAQVIHDRGTPSSAALAINRSVVTPLEHGDVLVQLILAHAAERPQEVPQPRPQPLRVLQWTLRTPSPSSSRAHSPAAWQTDARDTRLGQPAVRAPLVGVARAGAPSPRRPPGSTSPRRSAARPTAAPAALTPDDPETGGRSLSHVPWPGRCWPAAAAGRPGRCAAPLFPPRSGTSRRPPPPGLSGPGPGTARPRAATGGGSRATPGGRSLVRGPVGRWSPPRRPG